MYGFDLPVTSARMTPPFLLEFCYLMQEKPTPPKKTFSPDWLVHGILTKLGDTLDRLTGRGWKPSSSLATSELIEKLKQLLDAEAIDKGPEGTFVPHNIKLKMQWDKFSTDTEESLKKLENELLTAAVDHINDRLYYTYAPLVLEVKPDYFTEGVKLFVGFDKFGADEREGVMHVSVPGGAAGEPVPEKPLPVAETFVVRFTESGQAKELRIVFSEGRRMSVGRTKENDLTINDESVSKIHASLVLNAEQQLMLADTGSTNGTFINDERIAYGKAMPIGESDSIMFGLVKVAFERVPRPPEPEGEEAVEYDSVSIDGFEFRKRTETDVSPAPDEQAPGSEARPTEAWTAIDTPAPTEAAIEFDFPADERKT
jgi:pSer/pThr/pTyr-binding forkhead associated (FHA) protein